MTAQTHDTILYNEESCWIIGASNGELFNPIWFGIVPEIISTACYRGYYATFEIKDSNLFLQEITLNGKDKNYSLIFGTAPEIIEYNLEVYHNLNWKCSFTGSIRIGSDFIPEFYIHMGFQKPTAFKKVLDIKILEGKILEVVDRSFEVQKRQGEFYHRYKKLTKNLDFISKANHEAFLLDMELR